MSNFDENSIAAKHAEDDGDEAVYARRAAKAREAMRLANECARCGEVPTCMISEGGRVTVECEPCGLARSCHGRTAVEAVENWNTQPIDFECAGYAGCENRVDGDGDICGECEMRDAIGPTNE